MINDPAGEPAMEGVSATDGAPPRDRAKTGALPDWLGNVPLKTVGVLCATHIFGKNIESRQILLAGKRYFHNAVENVVGYVLNPILPPIGPPTDNPDSLGREAAVALRNIRDCFNYIFHIQVEYFKILQRLRPGRFHSDRTGREFNLNQFMAKGPTLINSEKRYLILSRIDGAQPFDLRLNWAADFDWTGDDVRDRFRDRLFLAQEAYAETLRLGEWYAGRDKNLILPLKVIMDDLSEFFEHLGAAAYLMARKLDRRSEATVALIRGNLLESCRHLERFSIDMLRVNAFSVVKHDLERLGQGEIDAVVRVRAEDDSHAGPDAFARRHREYGELLLNLYRRIGFAPAGTAH